MQRETERPNRTSFEQPTALICPHFDNDALILIPKGAENTGFRLSAIAFWVMFTHKLMAYSKFEWEMGGNRKIERKSA